MDGSTNEAGIGAGAGAMVWTGRVLSGIVILFFLMDGGMKTVPPQVVFDTMAQLGWPTGIGTVRLLAGLLLGSTLLYAWPRTALLGAVLLTGYLGGATATHVRIGSPLFSHILFGAYLGVILWGGLWLRDARLRAIFPIVR